MCPRFSRSRDRESRKHWAQGPKTALICPPTAELGFQTDTQDDFTAAVERLTHRRVVAFMSANQTAPGVAAELFFLDATPLTAAASLA